MRSGDLTLTPSLVIARGGVAADMNATGGSSSRAASWAIAGNGDGDGDDDEDEDEDEYENSYGHPRVVTADTAVSKAGRDVDEQMQLEALELLEQQSQEVEVEDEEEEDEDRRDARYNDDDGLAMLGLGTRRAPGVPSYAQHTTSGQHPATNVSLLSESDTESSVSYVGNTTGDAFLSAWERQLLQVAADVVRSHLKPNGDVVIPPKYQCQPPIMPRDSIRHGAPTNVDVSVLPTYSSVFASRAEVRDVVQLVRTVVESQSSPADRRLVMRAINAAGVTPARMDESRSSMHLHTRGCYAEGWEVSRRWLRSP